MRTVTEHEYTTYPRRFDAYKWYKPILVGLLFLAFDAVFSMGLINLLTKLLFGATVSSTGYEEIIRYFAVHDYLVAYDSYTRPMLHNYLLYESGGRLAMLPRDYDIAYGTFPADARMDTVTDSTAVVNTGIDSPLGNIADEDRPMWNWILSDESYLNEYHNALSELVDVIDSGEFEKEADMVYDLILPYIEKDPKAFFKPDESGKAYETVLRFTELRAESVHRQLNGQLAVRSDMQVDKDKVDASGISIKDMGSLEHLNR